MHTCHYCNCSIWIFLTSRRPSVDIEGRSRVQGMLDFGSIYFIIYVWNLWFETTAQVTAGNENREDVSFAETRHLQYGSVIARLRVQKQLIVVEQFHATVHNATLHFHGRIEYLKERARNYRSIIHATYSRNLVLKMGSTDLLVAEVLNFWL